MAGRLSFDYVRHYYGVPAKRGMRVTVDGKPGRITSGNGHYVRVLFDHYRHPFPVHPTWRVVYHTGDGDQVFDTGPDAEPPSYIEVRTTACRAGMDGECFSPDCPQIRDGEPAATGRHCPLDARGPQEDARG